METIRFTLWESKVDQLSEVENQPIAISRACVSSYRGTKLLNSKWHTAVKVSGFILMTCRHILKYFNDILMILFFQVNPDSEEANQMLEWFKAEIQT